MSSDVLNNNADALDLFRSRLYAIFKGPLAPSEVEIDGLSKEYATLLEAVHMAGERLLLDTAEEIGRTLADGIGLTLLQIHKSGAIPGNGQLQSAPLQAVANLLMKDATKVETK